MKKALFCLVASLAAATVLHAATNKPSASSLLREGNALLARGDARGAAAKLEQGLELAKKSAEKSGENGFYLPLGETYTALGEYHKAIFYLTEALARAERRKDGKSVSVALLDLGTAYAAGGEDRRAVSCYKDALRIAREYGSRTNTGRICAGLGAVYSRIGAPVRAAGYYADALNILKGTASRREMYDMSLNLGRAYADLQEYGKAFSCGSDALKLAPSPVEPKAAAAAYSLMGRAETGLGRIGDAEKHFTAAAKIYGDLNDLASLKEDAACMSGWYRSRGDAEKAAACYDAVQRCAEQAEDKQALFGCFAERGKVFEQAHDYRKALYYYGEAGKCLASGNGTGGDVALRMADLYARTGETAAAEEKYLLLGDPVRLGFLELSKKNYRAARDHFARALKNGENAGAATVFAARTGLGEVATCLKDPVQAEQYFADAAGQLEDADPGTAVTGRDLPPYPPGFSRTAPLERLVELRVGRNALPEAFCASEQARSVTFDDAVGLREMRQDMRTLPVDLDQEERITLLRLSLLGKEVHALSRSLMMEDAEVARDEYGNVRDRFHKLVGKVREYDPAYASFAYPAPMRPEEIRLGPDEALLEFEVTGDRTYLFIIDGKNHELLLRTVPLDRRALAELVAAYRSSLQTGAYDAGRGKKLFKTLFDDVLGRFTEGTTLVIVPDEALASLSFESLPAGKNAKNADRKERADGRFPAPRGIRYLGDTYRIVYAQSARSFNDRKERARPFSGSSQVLLVDTGDSPAPVSGSGYEEKRTTGAATQPSEIPLFRSNVEVLKDVRVMLGTSAVTASSLAPRKETAAAYRCLVFGADLPSPDDPGRFKDIVCRRFPADAAIVPLIDPDNRPVPACEGTVVGRVFQCAGVRNVLLGLWPVSGDVTLRLYRAYLREIRGGKEAKEALAVARNEVREAGFENPFYWAGFILVGY